MHTYLLLLIIRLLILLWIQYRTVDWSITTKIKHKSHCLVKLVPLFFALVVSQHLELAVDLTR